MKINDAIPSIVKIISKINIVLLNLYVEELILIRKICIAEKINKGTK